MKRLRDSEPTHRTNKEGTSQGVLLQTKREEGHDVLC